MLTSEKHLSLFENISSISFVVTRSCNLSCDYCSVSATNTKNILSMGHDIVEEYANTIFSQSKANNIFIVFFGGEPLVVGVDWYILTFNILKKISEKYNKKLSYGIQTNGTIINESIIDLILKNNINLSISFDGPDEYNNFRGKTNKVVDNINFFHSKKIYPAIIALIHPENWNNIDEIMRYFYKNSSFKVRFNTLRSIGRGEDFQILSDEQLLKAYISIIESQISLNIKNKNKIIEKNISEKVLNYIRYFEHEPVQKFGCSAYSCHAGKSYIAISPIGEIYPCADVTYTRPNMYLTKRLTTVSKENYQKVYDKFHYKNSSWDKCFTCNAKIICDFGCQAYLKPDEEFTNSECEVTKSLYSYLEEHSFRLIKHKYCFESES